MILKTTLFRRITIAGVGLIGGSIGLAAKKFKLAKEVVGFSYRQTSLVEAIKYKAIDTGETDLKAALRNSELVILATPVATIINLLTAMNPYLRRGCIITDVGSSKADIVEAAEKVLTHPGFFVGSHPLAGSEKRGVQFATDSLFEGAQCVMTPTKVTNPVAKEKVRQFWTRMGGQVKLLTPEEHDETLAFVSHLPHVLAYGLMETVPDAYFQYASTGFKDTTRIASSPANMWTDICLSNSKNVLKAVDHFVKVLSEYRKLIVTRDNQSIEQHFTKAKEKRDGL